MELLPNGFSLEVPSGCFPLSTDSMALAHFARLPARAKVLDLGSGCGTLGLLLCARDLGCTVTGVELSEQAHQAALDNIARNGLSSRMESIRADLRQLPEWITPGSFSAVISNPPYFSGGPGSRWHLHARRQDSCTTEDLFRAAAWAVKYGGDFFLVHRPEALGELICTGGNHGLEAKRLCLLRHRPDSPVNLILLSFRKGARPGLVWEDWTLYNPDGTPSRLCRQIYHIQEA